jgi:hypothetical protein
MFFGSDLFQFFKAIDKFIRVFMVFSSFLGKKWVFKSRKLRPYFLGDL